MFRMSLLLMVVVCLATPIGAVQGSTAEVLPAGMLLRCTLDEPRFSSATAEIGDPVLCNIGTLDAFGHSIFPRGAYLAGRFQDFRDPGRLFGKGWVELAFDHLVLPGAVTIPLSVKVISVPHLRVEREGNIHGLGHPKRDAIGWAIPVLWPVKLLTLPARGPRPTLKGEVRITVRLMADLYIPAITVASRLSLPSVEPSSQGASSPRQWSGGGSRSESSEIPTLQTSVAPEATKVLGASPFAERLSGRQLTILLLKDDTGYLATDYWLEGTKLHCLTLNGEHKVMPLGKLDLTETVRVNRDRNVDVVLRSKDW
jgi:hypothetical protein